jgi:hypothetical protein
MKAFTAVLIAAIVPALAQAQQGPRSPVAGGVPVLTKALAQEIAARKAGDAATLAAAKAYTDEKASAAVTVRPATAAECPFGGTAITASSGTQLVCNGAPGQEGPPGAGATMAYTKRGQWYDGLTPGSFSRTFDSGEALLALDLPAGTYLLTAHVFALPEPAGAADASILCSVGKDGGPVGSGEAKWLRAMDAGQTTAIVALGTYYLDAAGVADLRCYSTYGDASGRRLKVAQASLTALRIDTLVYQQ